VVFVLGDNHLATQIQHKQQSSRDQIAGAVAELKELQKAERGKKDSQRQKRAEERRQRNFHIQRSMSNLSEAQQENYRAEEDHKMELMDKEARRGLSNKVEELLQKIILKWRECDVLSRFEVVSLQKSHGAVYEDDSKLQRARFRRLREYYLGQHYVGVSSIPTHLGELQCHGANFKFSNIRLLQYRVVKEKVKIQRRVRKITNTAGDENNIMGRNNSLMHRNNSIHSRRSSYPHSMHNREGHHRMARGSSIGGSSIGGHFGADESAAAVAFGPPTLTDLLTGANLQQLNQASNSQGGGGGANSGNNNQGIRGNQNANGLSQNNPNTSGGRSGNDNDNNSAYELITEEVIVEKLQTTPYTGPLGLLTYCCLGVLRTTSEKESCHGLLAGFIWVTRVDEMNSTMSVVMPCKPPVPSNYFIVPDHIGSSVGAGPNPKGGLNNIQGFRFMEVCQ
jgi:hypothetical protein